MSAGLVPPSRSELPAPRRTDPSWPQDDRTPPEQQYAKRRIIYLGLTDGKARPRWLRSEIDHEALLDELETREKPLDRFVETSGGRGVLVRVFRHIGHARTLVVYKVEPAAVISLLRGEEVEEFDPGEDASQMYPSWVRFHSGNRIAMLKGPGGAGSTDLMAFLNKLEPSLFEGVPRHGRARSVGLVPLLSRADYATIARTARRVTALSLSLPPERNIQVDESLLSEVLSMLRGRFGPNVRMKLEVTTSPRASGAAEAGETLQQEVGHIVQSDDLEHFATARMTYDQDHQTGLNLDLLADAVAARVKVSLGPRGALTDSRCAEALTEAWAQVQDRLPWAVAGMNENGDDDADDEGGVP